MKKTLITHKVNRLLSLRHPSQLFTHLFCAQLIFPGSKFSVCVYEVRMSVSLKKSAPLRELKLVAERTHEAQRRGYSIAQA